MTAYAGAAVTADVPAEVAAPARRRAAVSAPHAMMRRPAQTAVRPTPRPRRAQPRRWPWLGALLVALACGLAGAGAALGHPGDLDEFGGHFDEKTGVYHYHRPSKGMAVRKSENLEWTRFPLVGIVKGRVARIDEAGSLWLHVPYRPAYQELAQQLGEANRDDHDELLRVDLTHVSPKETGARDPRFAAWFREKVVHDVQQKLLDQDVAVHFEIVGGREGRLRGMVFQGTENVNLWMVLNGLSYYVLSDGDGRYDKLFRDAEDIARRDRTGIWEHIR